MASMSVDFETLAPLVAAMPCPSCGEARLHLEERLEAKPVGTFSLSGSQMKFSAHSAWWMVCGNCGLAGTVNRVADEETPTPRKDETDGP